MRSHLFLFCTPLSYCHVFLQSCSDILFFRLVQASLCSFLIFHCVLTFSFSFLDVCDYVFEASGEGHTWCQVDDDLPGSPLIFFYGVICLLYLLACVHSIALKVSHTWCPLSDDPRSIGEIFFCAVFCVLYLITWFFGVTDIIAFMQTSNYLFVTRMLSLWQCKIYFKLSCLW